MKKKTIKVNGSEYWIDVAMFNAQKKFMEELEYVMFTGRHSSPTAKEQFNKYFNQIENESKI